MRQKINPRGLQANKAPPQLAHKTRVVKNIFFNVCTAEIYLFNNLALPIFIFIASLREFLMNTKGCFILKLKKAT